MEMLTQAMSALACLLYLKYGLVTNDQQKLQDALDNFFRDIIESMAYKSPE